MATHSSILAQKILRAEEPGGATPGGRKESDTTELLAFNISNILQKNTMQQLKRISYLYAVNLHVCVYVKKANYKQKMILQIQFFNLCK